MEAPPKPQFTPNPTILATLQKQRPIVDKVKNTFGDEGRLALSVLLAENTSLNPTQRQIGGGPARGLWQFEPPTWKDMGGILSQMDDPFIATDMAKKLRDKRGWGQWSAFNNKKHEQYDPYWEFVND